MWFNQILITKNQRIISHRFFAGQPELPPDLHFTFFNFIFNFS
jgi:hypothetical protein